MLPFCWWLIASQRETHREETGVLGPSRKAMANIRHNARKKGISEQQAYEEWLKREQRKKG